MYAHAIHFWCSARFRLLSASMPRDAFSIFGDWFWAYCDVLRWAYCDVLRYVLDVLQHHRLAQEYDAYELFRSETLKMQLKASASGNAQLRTEGRPTDLVSIWVFWP
jgi:hypothetical protein